MKKIIYFFASALLILTILLTGTSCKEPPNNNVAVALPTTKITPRTGESVQLSQASMPNWSIKDITDRSEMAFIGTVKEILPSQWGVYKESGRQVVYTDVAIVPERYLFGGSDLTSQIVRVYTGRVASPAGNNAGNLVAISDGEPTFTVNERVLVFVSRYSSTASVSGNTSSYLRVIGDGLGEYHIKGSTAVQDFTKRSEQLSQIEAEVSSVKR